MAPAEVSEKFHKARTDIENYTGQGSPIDVVLADWSNADKVAFGQWYSTELATKRTESINKQKAVAPMTMAQYIDAVKGLNFKNDDSMLDFINKTQIRDWEPYPLPIILGCDGSTIYQLRSQLVDMEATSDIPSGTPLSEYIYEIRATAPNVKSPTQYIYSLGMLEYTKQAGSIGTETPFKVGINPVDRSVWLIMTPYSLDGVGNRVPIPLNVDTWPYAGTTATTGTPPKKRDTFDVIQIATWAEFVALNQTNAISRAMFTKAGMRVGPKAWIPSKTAVEQALKGS